MSKDKQTNWKRIAIIFIVISILEFTLIAWAFNSGSQALENENTCSVNVCMNYDAFYYDDYEDMCYCYEGDDIVHQEYMR